jgi:uncharacterized protein (TIGR03067 family)
MRKATMVVAGILVAVALQVQAEDKKDAPKLTGTWTVTAEEKDGKQQTAEGIQGRQVKITRDTITCTEKDRTTHMAAKYELDASRTPWTISMSCTEGELKGKTVKGIAELQDDTLKICFAQPDQEAPADFKTKENQCCITMKREAK